MSWAVLAAGLVLAVGGVLASMALGVTGRAELARLVSRRLRGGPAGVGLLGRVEDHLTAAAAATSLGAVVIGASLPGLLGGRPVVTIGLVLALLLLLGVVFGGQFAARWLTVERAERLVRRLDAPLGAWARVLRLLLPARPAREALDVASLWRPAGAAGPADDELLMIGGVMSFAERPVREVMTPRTDVVAVAEETPLGEIRDIFAQSGYSRIPVYRGTLDDIVGMLHAFDLFRLQPGDPLPVRPVAQAPGSRACGDLLLDMQRERRHLAVVLDEYGGTAGIATLEDLLEELVGEIYDEHDVQALPGGAPPIAAREVDGATPVAAVAESFGVVLPAEEDRSIGGLLARLAGRIPASGERLLLAGLEFDVILSSPTRIERLLVRRAGVAPVPLDRPAP